MRIVLLLSLFITPLVVFPQQSWVDSVRGRIAIEKNDTEVVRSWLNIFNRLRTSDTTAALKCKMKVDSFARQSDKAYFTGLSFFAEGLWQMDKDQIKASSNFEKAIRIFSGYADNPKVTFSLASAYSNLGNIHMNNVDYPSAIDYYLQSVQATPKTSAGNERLSIVYGNISLIYSTLKKYEEALLYSKRSLDLAHSGNDKFRLMRALFSHGSNLVRAEKGDSGLPYLDTARILSLELNDVQINYFCLHHRAVYHYNNKRYDSSLRYFSACLALAKENDFPMGIQDGYINLSETERRLHHYPISAAYLDSSIHHVKVAPNLISLQAYYDNAAELYRTMGVYKAAFLYADSAKDLKDSIYQQDNVRQIEFRQARYAHEKQQEEIYRLEDEKKLQTLALSNKNILNYFLLTILLTLCIISVLFYRNYRQKQRLQQQRIAKFEREKQLAATEAVLKGEEQERTRLAKDLHDGLGGMLSGIKYSFGNIKGNVTMLPEHAAAFQRSMEMLDSSIQEMRRVAHNMMPEALVKFGLDTALKDFCNDIHTSGALTIRYQSIGLETAVIDQTAAITIYRIVQELINNILKHAAAKNVLVQLTKDSGQLFITVEDDGKGFNTDMMKQGRGIGWNNILSRIEFLKGRIDLQSQPGEGTSVLIELGT